MTRSKGDDLPQDGATNRAPERGTRRLWPAIDARRRLNARPADDVRTKAEAPGNGQASSDPTQKRRAQRGPTVVPNARNEGEFNREIVRRAKRARERAAQSLKRARRSD
jgi:hypothetical protein